MVMNKKNGVTSGSGSRHSTKCILTVNIAFMAFGLLKSSVPSFITGKLEGSLHCGPSLAHCENFTELPSLTMY